MSRNSFHLEWQGLSEFKKSISNIGKSFDKELRKELMKIALETERNAKALSYYDGGVLENSIHTTNITKIGNTYIVYVGTNLEYATYLHELYNPTGRNHKYERGVKYPNYYIGGRGRRTREKPKVKGYTPGRKFLSNAVTITESMFEEAMLNVVERVLRGL